jgi:hypothetical protein
MTSTVLRFSDVLLQSFFSDAVTFEQATTVVRAYLAHAEGGRYRDVRLLESSDYCAADDCWYFHASGMQFLGSELCLTVSPEETEAIFNSLRGD